MVKKKAINSIVSVSLILLVAVISVVSFQSFMNKYLSSTFSNVENKKDSLLVNTGIETIVGEKLIFKNGYSNITIDSIKIGDTLCNFNATSYSKGFIEINLSNKCGSLYGTKEIVLVTNKGVFTKKLFLNINSINNSINTNAIEISVYNPNPYSLSNYPLLINITPIINEYGYTFRIEDFSGNFINYSFKQLTGDVNTTPSNEIWVKIPSINANGNISLFVYNDTINNAKPDVNIFNHVINDTVAIFDFEGNVNDLTGKYSASAHGISYGNGPFGKYIYGNGYNQYVSTNIVFSNKKLSYAVWSKTAVDFPHYRFIFGGYSRDTYWYSDYTWFVDFYSSNPNPKMTIRMSSLGPVLNLSQWYFVVFNIDHSTGYYEWYLDGNYMGNGTHSELTKTSPGNTIQIAGFTSFSSTWARRADVDEFKVFNHFLTQSDVNFLYGYNNYENIIGRNNLYFKQKVDGELTYNII